jgi:plasmid stability protein
MIALRWSLRVASITIRKLDDRLKSQLKHRAIQHGRSMEEEARTILRDVLDHQRPRSFMEIATELFGPEHGVELDIPPRGPLPEPPDFGEK